MAMTAMTAVLFDFKHCLGHTAMASYNGHRASRWLGYWREWNTRSRQIEDNEAMIAFR